MIISGSPKPIPSLLSLELLLPLLQPSLPFQVGPQVCLVLSKLVRQSEPKNATLPPPPPPQGLNFGSSHFFRVLLAYVSVGKWMGAHIIKPNHIYIYIHTFYLGR